MTSLDFIPFLHELAETSGDYIRPYFGDLSIAVEMKADESPVTVADKGAEKLMRDLINKKFPTHGLIGEEYGNENEGAEFVWVLDPIDGTKSFASACPLFGTLIALLHNGRPILGAIHQPILRQLMIGDGKITTLNGKSVRMRNLTKISDATLLTSDTLNVSKYQRHSSTAFQGLAEKARVFRTWGDCYGYLLLASGWADIMTDPIMNPWDIQALIPVIEGAGGKITDWKGRDPVKADSIIAASPQLHDEVVRLFNA